MKPLTLMTAIMVLFSASLTAAPKDAKRKGRLDGIKCPVKGAPVKANRIVKYRKANIYFCCPGCVAKFKKSRKKYMTKVNHQLLATGHAKQEKCPIRFTKLNPEQTLEVAGAKVSFCCGSCKGKVEMAKGEGQLELVFGRKAFSKAFKVGAIKPKFGRDEDEDD